MPRKERQKKEKSRHAPGTYCLNLARNLLIPTTLLTPEIASAFTCCESHMATQQITLTQAAAAANDGDDHFDGSNANDEDDGNTSKHNSTNKTAPI
jgi:hypothetical protein